MELATWQVPDTPGPVIATAIHNGHYLRPEVDDLLQLDAATRFREEDPFTGDIATGVATNVVVHRSRFEVDLNRDRAGSVYLTPDQAWGLDIWRSRPGDEVVDASRRLHDEFYRRLASTLDNLVDANGGFVLLDVHSYNHRRAGPEAPPESPDANPEVNLGTGSLPDRWAPVADSFVSMMRGAGTATRDVRVNIRFKGGYLASWVHDRYGQVGCALAIEFRKDFMDEWTGVPDRVAITGLKNALGTMAPGLWEAHRSCP